MNANGVSEIIYNGKSLFQVPKLLTLYVTKNGEVFRKISKESGDIFEQCSVYTPEGRRRINFNGTTLYVAKMMGQTFISNPDNKPFMYHINKINDDDRLENLKWITRSESQQKRKKKSTPSSSNYKGVHYDKTYAGKNKWCAQVVYKNKDTNIGRFGTEEEAAEAYDEFVKENLGEFATPNFP